MFESSRATPILRARTKTFALLLFVSALAIAAHLFNPTHWPPIGVDILHSLHGPGFALLALLILLYFQYQCRSVINYVLAASIAMGVGLASEMAQIPGARDAEIMDLVVDALGIFAAVGIAASLDKNVRHLLPTWARLLLPTAAAAALAVTCVPTLWLGHALIQQRAAFPTLLTFENRWESAAFGQTQGKRPTIVEVPVGWPAGGPLVARAVEHGRWGIFLSLHPLPNWSDYETLSFVIASAAEEFALDICINDTKATRESSSNRFCKSVEIGPLPQDISITFAEIKNGANSQHFDFTKVDAVVFSAAKPGSKVELLVDNIRLEL